MKRKVLLAVLALVLTFPVVAQEKLKECSKDVDKKELQAKVMKMKRATFTKNLKLTKEESEKFWPIYETFDKDLNAIMEKKHASMSKFRDIDLLDIDDEQATILFELEIETERAIAELKAHYYSKFSSVLPIQKVVKLFKEEKCLMRNLKKNEQGDKKCEKEQTKIQKKVPATKKELQLKLD